MDGELYARRHAIRLMPKKRDGGHGERKGRKKLGVVGGGDSPVVGESRSRSADAKETSTGGKEGKLEHERSWSPLLNPSPWFLFIKSNCDMEELVIPLALLTSYRLYGRGTEHAQVR